MITTLGDSKRAPAPVCDCCPSPADFFPSISRSWLRARTTGFPPTASSKEVRVCERAKLTCFVRCGGGAASWWMGMAGGGGGGGKSGCAGHGPARYSVL